MPLGKGGNVTILYDGRRVGEGRVERTVPFLFSADETLDVGTDHGMPVSRDYDRRTAAFSGRIDGVEIQIGEGATETADANHRMRIAIARQ